MDNQPQASDNTPSPNPNPPEQPQSNPQSPQYPQPAAQPQVIQPQTNSTPNSQPPQVFTHNDHTPYGKKSVLIAAIIVLVLVIAGAVAYLLLHKSSSPKNNSSAVNSSNSQSSSAALANKDNIERKNDIQAISAGIQEYAANNNNTLPQNTNSPGNGGTLQLCGVGCSQGTANEATVNLMYYKAYNIVFKSYTTNLTVGNADTVYIVNNATCTNNTSIGDKTTSQSAAIVYGLQKGVNVSSVQQECEEASLTL